jgi:hypothetical protein
MNHPDNTVPVTNDEVMFFLPPFSARYYIIHPKKRFKDQGKQAKGSKKKTEKH